jgi:large subunit ribosomal protein L18
MKRYQKTNAIKERRARRVRAKIQGTAERPRLSVFRSLAHISAQLIDDGTAKTVVSVHDRELKQKGTKTELALALGKSLAEKAKAKGVTQAVFDKGRFKFHGRVKAIADGARENGLQI